MGFFSDDRKNDGSDSDSGGRGWSSIVHGTDSEGKDVSASFGSGKNEGHTLVSDGHKDTDSFYGDTGSKGHDHYDGKGGGTDRGQYSGRGSK